MTWIFDDDPSNQQVLELTSSESDGATTVLLVNSRISTDEPRDAQDEGWHGCLDPARRASDQLIRHAQLDTSPAAPELQLPPALRLPLTRSLAAAAADA